MKNIVCIHSVSNNIGDFYSTPANYFSFLSNVQIINLEDVTENFIQGKNKKIYYIDTRMPLFTKNSNEGNRFNISKKKTLKFLK